MNADKWRRIGLILRWTLFGVNLIPWLTGIISLIGGFAHGFSNGLINMTFFFHDLKFTTPATVFIFYGSFMTVVTTVGYFSASTANKWVIIAYLISGLILFIVDITVALCVFISTNSMQSFTEQVKNSMDQYGVPDGSTIGILKVEVTKFWDHLQTRGHCCGFDGYEDWKNRTSSRKDDIPNTCTYAGNGKGFWRNHPDSNSESHPASDVIKYTKGCSLYFPESFNRLSGFSFFIGICFIICFIIATILLVLLFLKKYHPDWGIRARQQRRLSQISSLLKDAGPSGDTTKTTTKTFRRSSKVAPANLEDEETADADGVYETDGGDTYPPDMKKKRLGPTAASGTEDEYSGSRPPRLKSAPPPKRQGKPTPAPKYPTDISNSQQVVEEVSVVPTIDEDDHFPTKKARLS